MIESVVLPSLSSDLITITELLTEESSPGIWYCSVAWIAYSMNPPPVCSVAKSAWRTNLLRVSRYGSKDWYEEVWIEGWI